MKELVKGNLKVIERKEGQIYIGKKQRKNGVFYDVLNHITKQEKMTEILLDLYWNKEQARLIIEYGIESKGQLRKEIEKKAEESE